MTLPEATPAEIFIAEHRLEFSDSGEAGPTWTALSACDGEPFELLFRADRNGPTALQITRYYSFLENFAAIRERIQTAFKSPCMSLGAEIARKFQDRRAEIDIVTVSAEGEDGEIEVCCRASRGWTIFSKHILFAVDLRANKIVKLTGA
jgi:phage-related baseplate assembly protein